MLRAISHLPAGHAQGTAFDSVVLDHDQRRLRRKFLTLTGGGDVVVDLPRTVTLDHLGALQLDDGRLVEVIAAPELLYEVRGRDAAHLVRLAWHIGNRHTSAQLEADRLLIKRDHVLRPMLEGLGGRITEVREHFFAEHGAYHSHADTGHVLLAR